eukprot:363585-Chlamydomonas_euryale.AAC.10
MAGRNNFQISDTKLTIDDGNPPAPLASPRPESTPFPRCRPHTRKGCTTLAIPATASASPCHTSNLLRLPKFQGSKVLKSKVFKSVPPGLYVQGMFRRRCLNSWLRDQYSAASQLEEVPKSGATAGTFLMLFHAATFTTDLANEQSKHAVASSRRPFTIRAPSTEGSVYGPSSPARTCHIFTSTCSLKPVAVCQPHANNATETARMSDLYSANRTPPPSMSTFRSRTRECMGHNECEIHFHCSLNAQLGAGPYILKRMKCGQCTKRGKAMGRPTTTISVFRRFANSL